MAMEINGTIYYTPAEVAKMVGVSPVLIRKMIKDGYFKEDELYIKPCRRLSRYYLHPDAVRSLVGKYKYKREKETSNCYLNPREFAEAVGVTLLTVQNWIRKGKFKGDELKVEHKNKHNNYYIDKKAIERFKNRNK